MSTQWFVHIVPYDLAAPEPVVMGPFSTVDIAQYWHDIAARQVDASKFFVMRSSSRQPTHGNPPAEVR